MYSVYIKFEQNNLHRVVLKNVKDGQTLLELLLANEIELTHDCGGVCSCTTCHVYVEKGMMYIEEMSRREEDFIRKKIAGCSHSSRLSCQALIAKGSGEIEIMIPVQIIK